MSSSFSYSNLDVLTAASFFSYDVYIRDVYLRDVYLLVEPFYTSLEILLEDIFSAHWTCSISIFKPMFYAIFMITVFTFQDYHFIL